MKLNRFELNVKVNYVDSNHYKEETFTHHIYFGQKLFEKRNFLRELFQNKGYEEVEVTFTNQTNYNKWYSEQQM